jgi:hypothetical protein
MVAVSLLQFGRRQALIENASSDVEKRTLYETTYYYAPHDMMRGIPVLLLHTVRANSAFSHVRVVLNTASKKSSTDHG